MDEGKGRAKTMLTGGAVGSGGRCSPVDKQDGEGSIARVRDIFGIGIFFLKHIYITG
jgi:hypothetical protein